MTLVLVEVAVHLLIVLGGRVNVIVEGGMVSVVVEGGSVSVVVAQA